MSETKNDFDHFQNIPIQFMVFPRIFASDTDASAVIKWKLLFLIIFLVCMRGQLLKSLIWLLVSLRIENVRRAWCVNILNTLLGHSLIL